MSTTNDNKRQQLIGKLREMFQMARVELDFGIHRILNARWDEISQGSQAQLLVTLGERARCCCSHLWFRTWP
ncbi:MAG: hypothetical protein Q8K50_19595 [Hydrogenophaga sp.]|jgi:adenine-specific DNA-methyltransferase|nr:hypothetical protein [Hydrogenophaga sp.]MDP3828125.1 hypothetical protein [Polaromonas sp.]